MCLEAREGGGGVEEVVLPGGKMTYLGNGLPGRDWG